MSLDSSLLYAPCPCGSGRKFKFCHYEQVRHDLPPRPDPADVAEAVREFLRPEPSKENLAAEEALSDRGFDALVLTDDVPESRNLPDPEERAAFEKLLRELADLEPGTEKWDRTREEFRSTWERHPDFFRSGFDYAAMLEEEGRLAEARAVLEKILAAHPEYGFAQAARVRLALREGDVALAWRLVDSYRPRGRMHGEEYLAWLRAVQAYCEAVDDEEAAENTAEGIKRIEEEFAR